MTKPSDLPADRPAKAELSPPRLIGQGFRRYENYTVTIRHEDGTTATLSRDLMRTGRVVGVVAVDPAHDEVVLIRQFRLAAHVALGRGDFVEIVAGYVDPGEEPIAAARRECVEEIGVEPTVLHEILSFLPAPGTADEYATLFLAVVDATRVPERAGAAHESEDIQPIRVKIDSALAALSAGAVMNGYLIIALQWLALNRHRLDDLARTGMSP